MGNKIARTTQVSATEYYLHDLPSTYNLVLVEILGRGRFFKSILCKHDEGLVLVKVYFKRGDPLGLKVTSLPSFLSLTLSMTIDMPALHRNMVVDLDHLVVQLLCAVEQGHNKGVCHGDIKCENVLVTSWNWLYLADFASFKPTYIPDDDPSDFSFFFDTGGRRRCYLAPEKLSDEIC
ncbi:hypothetical protein B296_00050752 [Ensete ventricosum]|uniref:Protein kinase domain-containing protein n=1 Tax=Ensete ventricosum TaxID=4639 RepID=A0A426XGS5_ENSVE|nr:hypothetical protein B296_00050752 [Ensete ventricosum]